MSVNVLWVLIVVLLVFVLLGVPAWGPWQHGWGYYPSGLGLVIIIVLLVLLLR